MFKGEQRPIVYNAAAFLRVAYELGISMKEFMAKSSFAEYELYTLIYAMFRQAHQDLNIRFFCKNLSEFIEACGEDPKGFEDAAAFYHQCASVEMEKMESAVKEMESEKKTDQKLTEEEE